MYTMMQVCRELDMTYQTLKYYCNEGLVPNVKRDNNNRRVFDEKDVKWIKDLTCLKKCGLSIQEMKEYLELCLQGESTIILRKEMLAKKQEALLVSIKELEDSVAYIDWQGNKRGCRLIPILVMLILKGPVRHIIILADIFFIS